MPAPYPPLTEDQKQYIHNHYKGMSLRAIAKNQRTCIYRVREYMLENNLHFRQAPGKKNGGKRKDTDNNRFFNPRKFGNWLVG